MGEEVKIADLAHAEPMHGVRYFAVTDALIEQVQDWSEPVQFKFEDDEDGRVTLLLRKVGQP